ncbi:glycoside hydrolase family 76 protein [Blastopirellula marina]|uniref:Putative glycosylhydrolase n=1 Tax=Blastopirellula marina DSM 3645 TaxID=314230 RepID=A3ZXY6_9BACT|nr:glycoside hydrolase family 76 protein [Blastopirellula marina]EAQ78697.1 putative glycosylhydrolase [Blastopirellula marina DSM 3645]
MTKVLTITILLVTSTAVQSAEPNQYAERAEEVTGFIQKNFFDAQSGVYFKTVKHDRLDYVWLQSVMFANLTAAARIEPDKYALPLDAYFTALDGYWDAKAKIPGYEAAPTRGNGNDKYYDDNAWLVITFLEAYETNHDPRYLQRADETQRFVLSGWDEEIGGGIWWHERHKDGTKNTCANGPAAVGCLQLAKFETAEAPALIQKAREIVAWTNSALQDDDGLFDDRKVVATGEIKRGKLTYNSALMLRANLGLYRATGESAYLDEAKRIGEAADWFLDKNTGLYRDAVRYSHFMIEADLELYRATNEPYLLERAQRNVDAIYTNWKANTPDDMMSSACIARALWLMSEAETEPGKAFWRNADKFEK